MKIIKIMLQIANKNQNSLLIFVAILSIFSSMLYTVFDVFYFNDVGLLTLAVARFLTALAALLYVIRALLNFIRYEKCPTENEKKTI